ncbi:MAG: cysteine desulfurase / selenocysteine lyase [Chloroflexi bacterium]|jgi:cysteine desulfurase/selenocysteine lyase|nr:MAG: cysteine desulfurase / selenocysteine lyase [Chloroflexota bacterium]
MLDVQAIRKDFPILHQSVHGKPLVYLDNAATTQKPRQVIQALVDYYEGYNSNVHRAVHTLGQKATAAYEESREKIANFIGAPSSQDIVYTRGTTEAINLVSYTWAEENIGPGDEIVVTEMEHHSNLVPWQRIAQAKGATLKGIPLKEDWTLDMSTLGSVITERTKLVAVTHMSNVLGTIVPVKEIVQAARRVGAKVLIDGAQAVPHMRVNVADLDCDFYAFSGHKMCGPTGIGALYVKEEVLKEMEPFHRGGEMVREVWFDRATWNDLPMRFEAGTPNIADAIALGAAVDYLQTLGMDNIRQHEIEITSYAIEAFKELEEDLDHYGPRDLQYRGGIISFYAEDVHPHDLGTFVDSYGVAIRTGHHCAMPLMRQMGLPATARASFYVYNTTEEIDILVDALKKALRYFSK